MLYNYATEIFGKRPDGTLEPLVTPAPRKPTVKPGPWHKVDDVLSRRKAEAEAQARLAVRRLWNEAAKDIPCRATSKLEEAGKIAELRARADERSRAQAEKIALVRQVERTDFREELRRDISAAVVNVKADADKARSDEAHKVWQAKIAAREAAEEVKRQAELEPSVSREALRDRIKAALAKGPDAVVEEPPLAFVILPLSKGDSLTFGRSFGRPLAVYRDKAKAEAAVRLLRAAGAEVELSTAPFGDL